MTRPFHAFSELCALLDALCEETITTEQLRRLEEIILAHPEAEAYYVQFMSQQADLAAHFGVLPVPTEARLRDRGMARAPMAAPGAAAARPPRRSRRLFWGGLALSGLAAGLVLALTVRTQDPDASQDPNPAAEASDSTVAVLLHAPGAVWGPTGPAMRPGAALPAGWLRLKSGFAHLEFYSGAIVILEGPAELKLISRTEAYCARGKLRATVPPQAQGFTIGSPGLDLVDRGTDFGLSVGEGDRTEVHVFQGKVELYEPHAGRQAAPLEGLATGQGVRLDRPGKLRPIKLDPAAFLTAQDLAARSAADVRRSQQQWRAASEALRKEASLEVYYSFQAEQPWSRTLQDQARGHVRPRDGAIVGCAWVSGRWPGKQALEFKRVSDRVRFQVPGEFDSVTLAAWVRVDGLPNLNNSLMMTDGWEEGGLHWQIGSDGTIILGVQGHPKGRGAHYHAVKTLTPQRFGQWIHLAVVYDAEAGHVTHYLDGRPVADVPVQFDIPLTIGRAELGNWNMATHRNRTPIRFFTGCMDEFLLFSRALSGQEVERLYTAGRPPS